MVSCIHGSDLVQDVLTEVATVLLKGVFRCLGVASDIGMHVWIAAWEKDHDRAVRALVANIVADLLST